MSPDSDDYSPETGSSANRSSENRSSARDGATLLKVKMSNERTSALSSPYAGSSTSSRSQSPLAPPFRNNSSSPLPPPATHRQGCMSAAAKRYKYLRRLLRFQQMDFEFALWQMIYLFVAPQKVYRNFNFRKQMKAQFARDDPAFFVLLTFWLCVSTVVLGLVLGLSLLGMAKLLVWVVALDCVGVGLLVASSTWVLSNRFLRRPGCAQAGQDVEWGYCFDVHLNAFLPLLLILHVLQTLLYHVLISHDWFISRLIGNSLWLLALGYYIYITFLGYSSLPILQNTRIFLYPLTILCIIYVVTLAVGWNVGISLMNFYTYRVM